MVIKKDLLPHISRMQSLWIMCIPWSLLSFQEESPQKKNVDLTAFSVILIGTFWLDFFLCPWWAMVPALS